MTLFLSFAHPDDETFLSGGTICRAAAAGVTVVLSTATRGEAGKVGDPPVCDRADLAVTREVELRRAVEILGVSALHLLGYRDRELGAAPPDEIRRHLVGLIRRYRPEVVVTFDPNGANLHPDHVAISRFTADAVAAADDPRWFPDAGPAHAVRRVAWVAGRHPWELARHPDRNAAPGVDFAIDVGPWWEKKAAALAAHATQHQSVQRNFLAHADVDRLLSLEVFRQGWGPPLSRRPLGDLFEDLS
jgi:N-acetylglucosamine malate deacetylase 2